MACQHRLQQWQCLGQEGVAGAAAAPLAAPLPPVIQCPAAPAVAVSYIQTLPGTTNKGCRRAADASQRVLPRPTPCHAWRMNGARRAPNTHPAPASPLARQYEGLGTSSALSDAAGTPCGAPEEGDTLRARPAPACPPHSVDRTNTNAHSSACGPAFVVYGVGPES